MMRLKVAVVFGGRSGEHEVSCNSASTVAKALSNNFDVFPVAISKEGSWFGPIPMDEIKGFKPDKYLDKQITILPNPQSAGTIYKLPDLKPLVTVNVFFPVLHGTYGEDGTIQGLFEMANVPYVGSGVLASAAGMDKVIMKELFAQAGLPQVHYASVSRNDLENCPLAVIEKIEDLIGYPCFIKPANLGSSVGISKAINSEQLKEALQVAALYDKKIIIEKGINAREIEVSILGNETPQASLPGEIVPSNEFYDYKAKYIDNRSLLHIPAIISTDAIKQIQDLAVTAFKTLNCSGLARVDFFINKDTQEILINEVNTLPGFTAISMYPKLWEHSGKSIEEITSFLINLALDLHQDKMRNKTFYE